MLQDPLWINAKTFREQCSILISYLHNEQINESISKLGKLFGSRHCVQKQYYKIQNAELLKSPGRPKLLNDKQHAELENIIRSWHSNKVYPSYDEIAEFILERYQISLDIESCRKYIENNMNFQNSIGVPLDQNRFSCSEKTIDEYYSQLEEVVPRVNPCFIYNLDEVGYQDYVDSRMVIVVVPEEFVAKKVSIPYDRNAKRCSALVAIALNGENVKPTLILPRVTIDSEIYTVLPHHCFTSFSQKNGFITTAIFLKWFENIFLPHLREKRNRHNYYGPALIILDGLKAHHLVLDSITEEKNNIIIIFLPAHSSDQTQMLDLGIFGTQKRISRFKVKPPKEFTKQSKTIIKMVTAIYRSTDPFSTVSAFRQAGIVLNYSTNGAQVAKVKRGCARGVRHYSPERLSQEQNKTEAQIDALLTRQTWEEIHKNSFRINVE